MSLGFKDFLGWNEEGKYWITRWGFPTYFIANFTLLFVALIDVLT